MDREITPHYPDSPAPEQLRSCLACEGTGWVKPLDELPACTPCHCGHEAMHHDRYGCMFRNYGPQGEDGCSCVGFGAANFDCPVCLGSGQVEAKPSVRDAMADAETATAIASHIYSVEQQTYGPALRREALPLMWMAGGSKLPLFKTREDRNFNRARGAARAAFRAVPGLRGEVRS